MDFGGRHIVITGASSGIGEASARLLHSRGARVTLIARRAEVLAAIAQELGQGAGFTAADVSDKDGLLAALDTASAKNGPISGLFLNAGVGGGFHPIGDYSDEQFDQLMQVNAASVFWAIRHVAAMMAANGGGAILATGSLASARGMANNIGYVASKHALLGIVRAAALELAPQGIRVNCLIPGLIDTPMMAEVPQDALDHLASKVPQGRLGLPVELAETAAFLLSDRASHITGQSLSVDGGIMETLQV
ncbi:SDR family NAD(P)-dependent oxidoreductase [Altererythrobacter sp.]|uniref:SDR family NAD(P)-dependent oxidoreductase n=1 Tax=Altererythrobacter sp. TaxID=1872480 RepID=UPI003D150551